jgi:hypothetical protein
VLCLELGRILTVVRIYETICIENSTVVYLYASLQRYSKTVWYIIMHNVSVHLLSFCWYYMFRAPCDHRHASSSNPHANTFCGLVEVVISFAICFVCRIQLVIVMIKIKINIKIYALLLIFISFV